MPIVKRRKKFWYTDDLDQVEDTVKISLNKEDVFEFELPERYCKIFDDVGMSFEIGKSVRRRGNKVVFDSMIEFESDFETVNYEYKTARQNMIQEKVLVIHIEAHASMGVNESVFRSTWGSHHGLPVPYVGFNFERGIKMGINTYKTDKSTIGRKDDYDGWGKLQNTINTSPHLNNNSDKTTIVIPYTEGREKFLRAFRSELSDIIGRMNFFIGQFEDEPMLQMMDNFTGTALLTAPAEVIEEQK